MSDVASGQEGSDPGGARLASRGRFRVPNQVLLLAIILASSVLLAYWPALSAGFIWDDDAWLTQNPLVPAADGLWRIWFTMDSPSQYFPMVYTTFWVEYALWGMRPSGFHLTNVALHILNALLLWKLLRELKLPGCWLAAAIFALHPVHVESVAWITERKNVLSMLFSLASALAWIRFLDADDSDTDSGGPARTRSASLELYAVSLGLYGLALLSKTTACTIPAGLMLCVWLRGRPLSWNRWLQIAPYLALGLAMGLLTVWWEEHHQGTDPESLGLTVVDRTLIASRALWFYLGRLVWPSELSFVYPRWTIDASDPLQYVWVVLCGGAAAALWRFRFAAGRGPAVAIAFFAASLSPLLGFLSLYTFHYTFVMDHYLYVASIGPIALFAAAATRLGSRLEGLGRRLSIPAAGVLLAVLAALTWSQSRVYLNPETLWRDTLAKNPDSWMVCNNLGEELRRQGRVEEAIPHLEKAIQLKPDYVGALNNMALALNAQGYRNRAIEYQRRALAADPRKSKVHYNLGMLLHAAGKSEEAIPHLRRAIEINSDYGSAHQLLGAILSDQGKPDEAAYHHRRYWEILEEQASRYRAR